MLSRGDKWVRWRWEREDPSGGFRGRSSLGEGGVPKTAQRAEARGKAFPLISFVTRYIGLIGKRHHKMSYMILGETRCPRSRSGGEAIRDLVRAREDALSDGKAAK